MPRKTKFKINLGNKIKSLRTSAKMTQEELGKKIGVKKSTIANYESGYSEPESEKLSQIATIFDVTIDYIIGNTNLKNSIIFLEEKLSNLNLSDKELEEAYRNILSYYSINISNDRTFGDTSFSCKKVELAYQYFFQVVVYYFNYKLDSTFGDDFDITKEIKNKNSYNKFIDVKKYTINKFEEIYNSLDKNKIVSIQEENIFKYTVDDDSMLPLLDKNDIAIIQKNISIQNNKTYLVFYNDKTIIRKIIDNGDTLTLLAMNPYYPIINVSKDEIEIIGKVIKAENSSAFR